jgi:hypothetical protein
MQRMPIRGTAIAAVALFIFAISNQTATAGQTIQLLYSGSDSSGRTFNGCVQYDQSKPKDGTQFFKYLDATYHHEACYITSVAGLQGSGVEPEPFSINTSANNNKGLEVITLLGSNYIYVTFFTNVKFGPLSPLPYCQSGGSDVFQNAGTFLVTDSNGGQLFSGTINSVQCSQPTVTNPHCPTCTLSVPASDGPQQVVSYTYAASAPYAPVNYAFAPRQSCCLTRLFSWNSCRNRCW